MENTEIIERLVSVEEARKSNTKRIDELEEDLQTIDDKYKEKEETEQLDTEVNSNEQIEHPLEENVESEEE